LDRRRGKRKKKKLTESFPGFSQLGQGKTEFLDNGLYIVLSDGLHGLYQGFQGRASFDLD